MILAAFCGIAQAQIYDRNEVADGLKLACIRQHQTKDWSVGFLDKYCDCIANSLADHLTGQEIHQTILGFSTERIKDAYANADVACVSQLMCEPNAPPELNAASVPVLREFCEVRKRKDGK